MKIEPNPKLFDAAKPHFQKPEKNDSSQTFGQILAEQTQSKTSPSHQISGPPPLAGLHSVNLMSQEKLDDKSVVIEKTEGLLDVLDQYREYLSNPNISLREIEPLTREMMYRADELTSEMNKLEADDSLTPILNEILFTVSLETKKFENGWYNP